MIDGVAESIRIGCVKYLNAQPLIHGWPGPVVFDHPSNLCRQLAAGELDVALVSSFEFLRNPVYTIVDNVAVSSSGPVYSVFVAHEGAIEEVQEIALDPASSTSVNLLRCLLAERGLHPRLDIAAGISEGQASGRRAQLLIGDQAIRYREQHGASTNYWDLGTEWNRATGLPFVFALWLVRPEVPAPAEVAQELRVRRDANLSELDRVIAAQKEFSSEFCAFYFRECLHFGFGEPEKAGLWRFRSLCEKHRILQPNGTILKLA